MFESTTHDNSQNYTTLLTSLSSKLLLFVAVLLLFTYTWPSIGASWRKYQKLWLHARKLPGPPALPLIGNALSLITDTDEVLNLMVDITTRYLTPSRFWIGPRLLVILTDPRDIKVALESPRASCKGEIYKFLEPFAGQGLITSSGPHYKAHRKIIWPMLNAKILNFYVEYFNDHSRRYADLLETKVGAGEIDIMNILADCTADIILDTILGTPAHSQSNGSRAFLELSDAMYPIFYKRATRPWLHSEWIFSLTELGKQQETWEKDMGYMMDNIIKRKRKEYRALERGVITSERPRLMIVEQLIEHVEKEKSMTDAELKDELKTISIAAQDTTATITAFAIMMLGMHPDAQDKVRGEILKIVGDGEVLPEHLVHLTYTEMVLKETMRLFPISTAILRQATGDINLESCTIPEGSTIMAAVFAMHRSPKYWEDPAKFVPERFEPEHSKDRHPYTYMPFGGGFRTCIGQKYASMCMKTMMVHMIRKFSFDCNMRLEDLKLKTDISIRSRSGYKVIVNRIQ